MQFGQIAGDGDGMVYIRLARLANLLLVVAFCELVGAANQFLILGGNHSQQLFDGHFGNGNAVGEDGGIVNRRTVKRGGISGQF